jgi:tRNA (guanine-N7-)-methyltransferase
VSSDFAQTIANESELVPSNCFEPLEFHAIFGRDASVEVDLGCGDGSFLAGLAAGDPAKDFLGIERLAGRVRSACRRIERHGLTNVRVARFEISYVVEHLLPPSSISVFYLLFPDPWPKRRHASRRLVTEEFLASLHRALCANGIVRIATDQPEYFRQITRLVAQSELFGVDLDPEFAGPVTKFERGFVERGVAIQRLELRKVSPAM